MTEDEAKTKWCPHAVASHTDPRGISGYARPELGLPVDTFIHACIGSACMAWRWSVDRTVPADISTIAAHMRTHSVGPLDASGATNKTVRTGYCGLAGAPQ
ncbi:hypothetical protein LJR164_001591 [Phenylobacterium sp. LjRoot164]|uniref:hypothetical protein n=1 Tax=unclassified Phenylobacterium TaxID=2640670 RepID=UPI003ECE5AD8